MPVIGHQAGLSVARIVLATDFSPSSEVAAEYAKGLIKHFDSTLALVHVADPTSVAGGSVINTNRTDTENMERLLTQLSNEGIRATAHTLEGRNAAAAIVGFAEQLKAELIVTGTHSRHGLSKAILGSCAEGVIRHATCPVLTVGPNAKTPPKGDFSFNTILFATDFGSDAAEKAAIALAFAQDNAAKIYLCHVLRQPGVDVSETLGLQFKFESALQKLVPQSTYDWCSPECVVEQGAAAPHILDLANKVGSDLIVLGAKRSSSWLTPLGSGVVGQVLLDARCPVMTICSN